MGRLSVGEQKGDPFFFKKTGRLSVGEPENKRRGNDKEGTERDAALLQPIA